MNTVFRCADAEGFGNYNPTNVRGVPPPPPTRPKPPVRPEPPARPRPIKREVNYHDLAAGSYGACAQRLCRRIGEVTDPAEREIIKRAIQRRRESQRWHEERARNAAWVAALPANVVALAKLAYAESGHKRHALLEQAGHALKTWCATHACATTIRS